MLDRTDLAGILARVTYRQGYTFEVYDTAFQGVWLAIHMTQPDAYREGSIDLHVRSPLPPFRDEQAFLDWLRWRLERVEAHEVHEFLRVDGRIVYNPHGEGADQPCHEPRESAQSPAAPRSPAAASANGTDARQTEHAGRGSSEVTTRDMNAKPQPGEPRSPAANASSAGDAANPSPTQPTAT